VAEVDLEAFYAACRVDGRCRPPYDPAMMVALLLYAYARGIRSSRVIERACEEDVAFRVLAAQQRADHATLARFVERHREAIAGLFGEVLTLCARSGLAKVGVIASTSRGGRRMRRATRTSATSNSRARSSRRPGRSARPRTSSTARRAATSCRPSSLPPRAAAAGCARPSSAGRPSARRTHGRCRAAARNASARPSAASRRSSAARCAPTGPTRPSGRAGG
jgi:Transposase domain (DUF772)